MKEKREKEIYETMEVNRMMDIGYGEELLNRVKSVFESNLSLDEVWERVGQLNDKFYEYRDVKGMDIDTINTKLLQEWEND